MGIVINLYSMILPPPPPPKTKNKNKTKNNHLTYRGMKAKTIETLI